MNVYRSKDCNKCSWFAFLYMPGDAYIQVPVQFCNIPVNCAAALLHALSNSAQFIIGVPVHKFKCNLTFALPIRAANNMLLLPFYKTSLPFLFEQNGCTYLLPV